MQRITRRCHVDRHVVGFKKDKTKSPSLQSTEATMDYTLKKARLLAKLQMAGGSKPSQRAQLLAKTKMHGDNKPSLKTQVKWDREKVKTLGFLPRCLQGTKAILKPAILKAATTKGAQENAKIAWIKAQRKKNELTLSAEEAKLPKPPAGTSTARRMQDPR